MLTPPIPITSSFSGNCVNSYIYSYSSSNPDQDAGYDVNTALGNWAVTDGCYDSRMDGGKLRMYAAMRPSPATTTTTTTATKPPPPVAAIAGGVAGGVVLFAVILAWLHTWLGVRSSKANVRGIDFAGAEANHSGAAVAAADDDAPPAYIPPADGKVVY